jgi:RING finger protein 170
MDLVVVGGCILQVWQYTSALQPCRCPICRQPINLLIPSDFDQSNEEQEVQRVLQEIANYNRIHGGNSVGIVQVSCHLFL